MAKQSRLIVEKPRPIENQERASDSIDSDRALGGERDRPIAEPRTPPPPTGLPVITVGQELANARQRKGKRLSDVWLVLKIRPDQLVAIEEGRFDVLPGRVYAIGYVRSYAAHLGLDSQRLVDRLKVELAGPVAAKVPAPDPLPLTERTVPLPHSGTVMAGLMAVTFVFFVYYALSSGRAVEPPVLPVPARLAAEAGLTEKAVADLPWAVEQRAPVLLPEPLPPVPTEIAVTPPAPPPVVVPTEPPQRVQAQLPQGKRFGLRNRASRITLRVHRPTHVAVQGARNRTFIDRPLAPGDTYRVPNMVGLRLTAPDAGAVELILDGVSLGFVGKDGATARGLSLNPQNIVDRQQRG
jgi:cytoskeleton protein RodZ